MKRSLVVLLALLLAGPVSGCKPQVAPPAATVATAPTPTIVEAPTPTPTTKPEPRTLTHPGADWGYPSPFGFYPRGAGYIRMSLLFDTLTWKDEKGIIPWLADEWEVSEDGTRWTFKLHQGVKWHDGEPLTAGDVAFAFGYYKEKRTAFKWNAGLDNVAKAEAVGEDGVAIYLTEPMADFLVETAGSLPIIPRHVWEHVDDPAKFSDAKAVVGSGPFVLAEYNKEQGRYVYEANPDYFRGRPKVDRLVFVKVTDEALALKTGTTDVGSFWGKEIEAVDQLKTELKFQSIAGPSFWVLQLIFNSTKPPLDQVGVRQAIAHAVDRAKIVEQVTHDGAIVANLGIISPKSAWYDANQPSYQHDPAKARSILQSLGLADLQLTLITTGDFGREAELVKADLEAAGIQVEVKTGDGSTVDGLLREGNYDLAINGHGGIASPSILQNPPWPASSYKNETYQALFEEQSRTIDEAKRRELVGELQRLIAEDLPVLTLYHPKMWLVYDPAILDSWFYTQGGVAGGIPIPLNKLIFLER